jgi:hypothetical protein
LCSEQDSAGPCEQQRDRGAFHAKPPRKHLNAIVELSGMNTEKLKVRS